MKKVTVFNKIYLFLLIIFSGTACRAEHIIFDLGGVLIETGYFQTMLSLGWEFVAYASTWRNPFGSQRILFNFLDSIKPENTDTIVAYDAHGTPLPPLMNDWLKGTIAPQDIVHLRAHA